MQKLPLLTILFKQKNTLLFSRVFFYFVTCANPAPIIKKQTQKKTKFIIKPFSFRTVKNLSMIYPPSLERCLGYSVLFLLVYSNCPKSILKRLQGEYGRHSFPVDPKPPLRTSFVSSLSHTAYFTKMPCIIRSPFLKLTISSLLFCKQMPILPSLSGLEK